MIKLWEGNAPGFDPAINQKEPNITPFLIEKGQPRGAVIVCPGGGYWGKADYEGAPVARWLNSAGISAFVLDYRVMPYKHPYPLQDAQRAIRTVRFHAQEWGINPDKIGILGFSAGGHLSATTGTHFDFGSPDATDPVERVSCRPDALVLCYPVVTFGEFRHDGSMVALIGENPPEALRHSLSNETQVTRQTPPAFLWHTANDEGVPAENSLLFASAMSKNKVPFELHVFPDGPHGLALGEGHPAVCAWTGLCATWLHGLGF
jgi:acetyl esterase/lipase